MVVGFFCSQINSRVNHLDANYVSQAKYNMPSVFVNKVLLEHNNTYWLILSKAVFVLQGLSLIHI